MSKSRDGLVLSSLALCYGGITSVFFSSICVLEQHKSDIYGSPSAVFLCAGVTI